MYVQVVLALRFPQNKSMIRVKLSFYLSSVSSILFINQSKNAMNLIPISFRNLKEAQLLFDPTKWLS